MKVRERDVDEKNEINRRRKHKLECNPNLKCKPDPNLDIWSA